VAKKKKPEPEVVRENSLAVEMGRIGKLFALYLMKDMKDEREKVTSLKAVGFSHQEIGDLLGKTPNNVAVTLLLAKKKKKPTK